MEMSRKSGGEVFKIWVEFIIVALEAVSWVTYSLHDTVLCDII